MRQSAGVTEWLDSRAMQSVVGQVQQWMGVVVGGSEGSRWK